MTKTFTPDDILRYLYKETSKEENQQLEEALLCDADLLDTYLSMASTMALLDGVSGTPSKRTIDGILEYSQSIDSTICH
jgi:hypothetical protein